MGSQAKIIDGAKIAAEIRSGLKQEVDTLLNAGLQPGLAVVLVGDNPASQVYVRNKKKACAEIGITSFSHELPADCTEDCLLGLVAELNSDADVHGILIQLPLPKHIDEHKVIAAMDPAKDADGLHPANIGKLLNGESGLRPCTPKGCQELLLRSGHDPSGQHVVIIGRSNLVGKPLAAILMQKALGADATVTVCHSRTRNLPAISSQADILIAAIGVPEFVKPNMVKDGAVVIDVGTSRVEDVTTKSGYRLIGDVEFRSVSEKAQAITPVPGGVGPMTITMLLSNTIDAAMASR